MKNIEINQKKNYTDCDVADCTVLTTLKVIGGKWKPAIIWVLLNYSEIRFGQMRKLINGITPKMLTQQLRELEEDGIVDRKIFAEVPPRVEYKLTEYGHTLGPLLKEMASWGENHQEEKGVACEAS